MLIDIHTQPFAHDDQVREMLRSEDGPENMTDAMARTIAMWWQSPRNEMSRLASTGFADSDRLIDDIEDELLDNDPRPPELICLIDWAIGRS